MFDRAVMGTYVRWYKPLFFYTQQTLVYGVQVHVSRGGFGRISSDISLL